MTEDNPTPIGEQENGDSNGNSNQEEKMDVDSKEQHDTPSILRLELLDVDCGPSDCSAGERLELSVDFTLDRPLSDASWEMKFVADVAHDRQEVVLGATDWCDYPRGRSVMRFEVPRLPLEGVKSCVLANTGLLVAALRSRPSASPQGDGEVDSAMRGGEDGRRESMEVAHVKLVTHIWDAGGGELARCIYSPLE